MKDEIINYVKKNNGAEIPTLQKKFNIPYKDVKEVIDELLADGIITYESGVKYAYVKKSDTSNEYKAELERCRAEALRALQDGDCDMDDDEEEQDDRRKYLEARRQEMLRRMQAETDADEEDEEDDENQDDEEDQEEMDEETLRYKALKTCIESGVASASLIQRKFLVSYATACKLIDWMELNDYVSFRADYKSRKVLITQEEFDKIFKEPKIETHIVYHNDDSDEKFSVYEKYIQEHLNDGDDLEDIVLNLRPYLIGCFEHGLQEVSVNEKYVLGLDGEMQFEIRFVNDGHTIKISDGGKTLEKSTQTRRKIRNVLKGFVPVTLDGDEIAITVENPFGALMALLILYSAVDAVKKMK